ncbi:MAG: OmpA family protein [Acidobacteriota bacterium]
MRQNLTTSNEIPLLQNHRPRAWFALAFLVLLTAVSCGGRPPPLLRSPVPTQPTASPPPVDVPTPPAVTPPDLEVRIEPDVIQQGESALLTWEATNADRVVIDHNIGSVETSGRIRFFPDGTTRYEVAAEGAGGRVVRNVTIEVIRDEIISEEILTGVPLGEQFENSVRPVFFSYDSATLTPSSFAILDESIDWLMKPENLQVRFLVEGHCDQRGTEEYNLALGDRRAQTVKAYLLAKGIQGGRVGTLSLGEERPFDLRQTKPAWALNRRAHFVLTVED